MASRHRVAFAVQECIPQSGQGRYTLELASRLARDPAWEVTVLTRRAAPLPKGVLMKRCPLSAPSRLVADRLFLAWAGRQARTRTRGERRVLSQQ